VKHSAFVISLVLSVIAPVVDSAYAEGFVDVHAGGSFSSNSYGTGTIEPVGRAPLTESSTVKFKPSVSVGLRGGYWLDSFPYLGVALDLSYYEPEVKNFILPGELEIFPISGLLMLRLPLFKSALYPQGRLQPYAGAGPAAFITRARVKLKKIGMSRNAKDTTVDLGLDSRAGINFLFSGQDLPGALAAFLEYRYTRFKPTEFKDTVDGVSFTAELDRLDTHHIVVGIGYHF